jgi:hypothetical protein
LLGEEGQLSNSLDCNPNRFAALSSRCHIAIATLSTAVTASRRRFPAREAGQRRRQRSVGLAPAAPDRRHGAGDTVKFLQTAPASRTFSRARMRVKAAGIHKITTKPRNVPFQSDSVKR